MFGWMRRKGVTALVTVVLALGLLISAPMSPVKASSASCLPGATVMHVHSDGAARAKTVHLHVNTCCATPCREPESAPLIATAFDLVPAELGVAVESRPTGRPFSPPRKPPKLSV